MKINRILSYAGVALLGLILTVAALATTIRIPPTTSEIAGVYCGYCDYYFLRLELDKDATGYLSLSPGLDTSGALYRVENWRVSDWIVELQMRPIDKDAQPITFRKLAFKLRALDGEVHGADWKCATTLYNEREWQARASSAQNRIARYRVEKH